MAPTPFNKTVQGTSSPHQTGDLTCNEILTRAPLWDLTCHFSDIPPNAPLRGTHRHISAPTLFCTSGKGWEWNDGNRYEFETFDLLVVPPYTAHQHGGDKDIGCQIFVPQTRMVHALGVLVREQIKFGEQTTFPEGTEPIKDENGNAIGYRIKKGVLGLEEDLEVRLGAQPNVQAAFETRRSAGPYPGEPGDTYERYVKLMHDEVEFCARVTHVIRFDERPWQDTRQGRIKFMVHPYVVNAARRVWLYLQEIPAGSRSGRHRHASEEQILVLEGRGYDVHDGDRWNWQKGDLISIPPLVEHQHFNLGEHPALLFSSMPSMCADLGLGGIEQLEDAPESEADGEEP